MTLARLFGLPLSFCFWQCRYAPRIASSLSTLQPDGKMLEEAANWNARMREQSPEGFELDEQHAPHITLIQRFIADSESGVGSRRSRN